jgi:hypothetical protein
VQKTTEPTKHLEREAAQMIEAPVRTNPLPDSQNKVTTFLQYSYRYPREKVLWCPELGA